jgi:hypothetical protein
MFEAQAQRTKEQFERARDQYPGEVVWAELASTSVPQGQALAFEGMVWEAGRLVPTSLSSVVHVEVLDATGQIVDYERFRVRKGSFGGYLHMFEQLSCGLYTIRISTWAQKNDRLTRAWQDRCWVVPSTSGTEPVLSPVQWLGTSPHTTAWPVRLADYLAYPLQVSLHAVDHGCLWQTDLLALPPEGIFTIPVPEVPLSTRRLWLELTVPATAHTWRCPVPPEWLAVEVPLIVDTFVEGGTWVHGLDGHIAVRISDEMGQPQAVEATVWKDNQPLEHFKTNSLGLASVKLQADQNARYHLTLASDPTRKYRWPEVLSRGYVLEARHRDADSIEVLVKAHDLRDVLLLGVHRGELKIHQSIISSVDTTQTYVVDVTDWSPGVLDLAVLDINGVERCRRMLFVHSDKVSFLEYAPVRQVFPGESVPLNLNTDLPPGTEWRVFFEQQRLDPRFERFLSPPNTRFGILQWVFIAEAVDLTWLSGWGNWSRWATREEQQLEDSEVDKALNIMLATARPRRHIWKEIRQENLPPLKFAPETLRFAGKVVGWDPNLTVAEYSPLPDVELSIGSRQVKTNANGEFRFDELDEVDKGETHSLRILHRKARYDLVRRAAKVITNTIDELFGNARKPVVPNLDVETNDLPAYANDLLIILGDPSTDFVKIINQEHEHGAAIASAATFPQHLKPLTPLPPYDEALSAEYLYHTTGKWPVSTPVMTSIELTFGLLRPSITPLSQLYRAGHSFEHRLPDTVGVFRFRWMAISTEGQITAKTWNAHIMSPLQVAVQKPGVLTAGDQAFVQVQLTNVSDSTIEVTLRFTESSETLPREVQLLTLAPRQVAMSLQRVEPVSGTEWSGSLTLTCLNHATEYPLHIPVQEPRFPGDYRLAGWAPELDLDWQPARPWQDAQLEVVVWPTLAAEAEWLRTRVFELEPQRATEALARWLYTLPHLTDPAAPCPPLTPLFDLLTPWRQTDGLIQDVKPIASTAYVLWALNVFFAEPSVEWQAYRVGLADSLAMQKPEPESEDYLYRTFGLAQVREPAALETELSQVYAVALKTKDPLMLALTAWLLAWSKDTTRLQGILKHLVPLQMEPGFWDTDYSGLTTQQGAAQTAEVTAWALQTLDCVPKPYTREATQAVRALFATRGWNGVLGKRPETSLVIWYALLQFQKILDKPWAELKSWEHQLVVQDVVQPIAQPDKDLPSQPYTHAQVLDWSGGRLKIKLQTTKGRAGFPALLVVKGLRSDAPVPLVSKLALSAIWQVGTVSVGDTATLVLQVHNRSLRAVYDIRLFVPTGSDSFIRFERPSGQLLVWQEYSHGVVIGWPALDPEETITFHLAGQVCHPGRFHISPIRAWILSFGEISAWAASEFLNIQP